MNDKVLVLKAHIRRDMQAIQQIYSELAQHAIASETKQDKKR